MASSELDTEPPPAVASLRSKFEQKAQANLASSSLRPSSSSNQKHLSPEPHRRVASTSSNGPAHEEPQLRSASSSSDLSASLKRPPPPPPARTSKDLSASASQLRTLTSCSPNISPHVSPVLIPITPRTNTNSPSKDDETLTSLRAGSVASLRSKFSTSHSSVFTITPKPTTVPFPSDRNIQPPALPRRTPSPVPSIRLTSSPEPLSRSKSNSISTFDEESDSESPLSGGPPPLPSRRPHIYSPHDRSSTRDSGSVETSGTSCSSPFSAGSSESDVSSYDSCPALSRSFCEKKPSPPPRPPRPPTLISFPSDCNSKIIPSTSPSVPPPLPVRRNTAAGADGPPRLPARPAITIPVTPSHTDSSPSGASAERRSIRALFPPPVRTIGLGDKLPPARRPPSLSSDEESGDEEDPRARLADALPDNSRSSRSVPTAPCHLEHTMQVPAYSGHVAVAGHDVLVATGPHIRAYNLVQSESCCWHFETKALGMKDLKVSCMEFKASAVDPACVVWVGTKEGHLFELEVATGRVLGTKPVAHAHGITHIFRHRTSMVTMDDTGKALVWSPDPELGDIWLAHTQPKVFRISEKQDFARMLGGFLWTAARSDLNGSNVSRGPIVKVYDVLHPGSAGRSLTATEPVGAVTTGTVLPSHPGHVYLGHEGGVVSVWALETKDGWPQCVETMKVSTSDVLSLEGVHNRLWAGGRNGAILAYDVSVRPWVVTNSWDAHAGLPVTKIATDPFSVDRCGMLCVYSVGRDEQIKFWDGLLGMEWISQELLKREREYSKYRELKALIVSWNVDSARPEMLSGDTVSAGVLADILQHDGEPPDIISFGLQEVIDLESRRMAAKTMLLGKKKNNADDGLAEHLSSAYRRWNDYLSLAVRTAMGPDAKYNVHTENLVGLFSCVFVKRESQPLKDVAINRIKRGMGGHHGNKGAIVARFVIDDSSICLINVHLAAGQSHVRQRNADVTAILEEKAVFPASVGFGEPLSYVGGGDGTMVLDHEIVFVNGDMNYRIDQRREQVIQAVRSGHLEALLAHDQLNKEMKFNGGFRFRSFSEGPLSFAPTYKYDRHSNEYDTSAKSRVPAWCDRVLWRTRDASRVDLVAYRRHEAFVSDHRPVSAAFRLTVKRVDRKAREQVRARVETMWAAEQSSLLKVARSFYMDSGAL